ncbi:MAG: prepilin-type N-terminal cleavage/methylation domain-containing protein [Phycisphaeraceae bacterium]|nr:prepilin-type N-terminal cleavage/methylation domain-containing protein [Phycisphaeraceae bacterium]
MKRGRDKPGSTPATRRGFTLLELLVSIAIIGVLLSVLLPALSRSIGAARGFRCQASLRSIAFDFSVFSDDQLHGDRGNDGPELGPRRFRLETFQESQYGIDEFWRWDSPTSHTLPDAAKNDPMRCSEMKGPITLTNNLPCTTAIEPARNVSFGFNMRLHRAEVLLPNGQWRLNPVILTRSALDRAGGRVPLVWDIDGRLAEQRSATPIFSAPAAGSLGPYYSGDDFWFPARRHNGAVNAALLDGSVGTFNRSIDETTWNWSFQP